MKLSGGERQRVALARVFLRDAPILVLDEATTHLDAVTEARVLREIRAFVTGRTSLIVSHRARELRLGDRVLALPSPRAGASPRGVG
jgi:ATP-binding cassette subfamily C protein CydCD